MKIMSQIIRFHDYLLMLKLSCFILCLKTVITGNPCGIYDQIYQEIMYINPITYGKKESEYH